MTSCTVSLFMPLISAPLLKVESQVNLDMDLSSVVQDELIPETRQELSSVRGSVLEAPPPGNTPLLI